MRGLLPFVALLPLALTLSGCVYALGVSHSTPVKMRVASSHPEKHLVRVTRGEQAEHSVAPDGAVDFTVPGYYGCSVYLFGALKVNDGSGEKIPVVELRRSQRVIRTLSLRQIAKLPADDAGYQVITMKD